MLSTLSRGNGSWNGELTLEGEADNSELQLKLVFPDSGTTHNHRHGVTISPRCKTPVQKKALQQNLKGEVVLPKTYMTRKGALLLFASPDDREIQHRVRTYKSKKLLQFRHSDYSRKIGSIPRLAQSVLIYGDEDNHEHENKSISDPNNKAVLKFLRHFDEDFLDSHAQPGANIQFYLRDLQSRSTRRTDSVLGSHAVRPFTSSTIGNWSWSKTMSDAGSENLSKRIHSGSSVASSQRLSVERLTASLSRSASSILSHHSKRNSTIQDFEPKPDCCLLPMNKAEYWKYEESVADGERMSQFIDESSLKSPRSCASVASEDSGHHISVRSENSESFESPGIIALHDIDDTLHPDPVQSTHDSTALSEVCVEEKRSSVSEVEANHSQCDVVLTDHVNGQRSSTLAFPPPLDVHNEEELPAPDQLFSTSTHENTVDIITNPAKEHALQISNIASNKPDDETSGIESSTSAIPNQANPPLLGEMNLPTQSSKEDAPHTKENNIPKQDGGKQGESNTNDGEIKENDSLISNNLPESGIDDSTYLSSEKNHDNSEAQGSIKVMAAQRTVEKKLPDCKLELDDVIDDHVVEDLDANRISSNDALDVVAQGDGKAEEAETVRDDSQNYPDDKDEFTGMENDDPMVNEEIPKVSVEVVKSEIPNRAENNMKLIESDSVSDDGPKIEIKTKRPPISCNNVPLLADVRERNEVSEEMKGKIGKTFARKLDARQENEISTIRSTEKIPQTAHISSKSLTKPPEETVNKIPTCDKKPNLPEKKSEFTLPHREPERASIIQTAENDIKATKIKGEKSAKRDISTSKNVSISEAKTPKDKPGPTEKPYKNKFDKGQTQPVKKQYANALDISSMETPFTMNQHPKAVIRKPSVVTFDESLNLMSEPETEMNRKPPPVHIPRPPSPPKKSKAELEVEKLDAEVSHILEDSAEHDGSTEDEGITVEELELEKQILEQKMAAVKEKLSGKEETVRPKKSAKKDKKTKKKKELSDDEKRDLLKEREALREARRQEKLRKIEEAQKLEAEIKAQEEARERHNEEADMMKRELADDLDSLRKEEEAAKEAEEEARRLMAESRKVAREEREAKRKAEQERKREEVRKKREDEKKRAEEARQREKEMLDMIADAEEKRKREEEEMYRREEEEEAEEERREEEERLLKLAVEEEEERYLEIERAAEEEAVARLVAEREEAERRRWQMEEEARRLKEKKEQEKLMYEEQQRQLEIAKQKKVAEEKAKKEEAKRRLRELKEQEAQIKEKARLEMEKRREIALRRREQNIESRNHLANIKRSQGVTRSWVYSYFLPWPREAYEMSMGTDTGKKRTSTARGRSGKR